MKRFWYIFGLNLTNLQSLALIYIYDLLCLDKEESPGEGRSDHRPCGIRQGDPG
jgi:hypothetical protein